MIHRNVPLVQQVAAEILAEISSGEMLGPDRQLPSEAQLSHQYDVSRGTVREALSRLELAGIVVRKHGAGTYVNHRLSGLTGTILGWLDEFDEVSGIIEMIRSSGFEASCRMLESYTRSADEVAVPLEIDPASTVVIMEKLLFASATPVIHCANYVPLRLVEPGVAESATTLYEEAQTTYEFLRRWCHRRVHHQHSEISAVEADEKLAELLKCKPGCPLLRTEDVGYSDALEPVFFGVLHFRADMVKFSQLRQPMVGISPPVMKDRQIILSGSAI